MSQDHASDRAAQLDRARAIASTPATFDALVSAIIAWAEIPFVARSYQTGLAERIRRAAGR